MSHEASPDEPLIVSVSGLRGVVGATLTPEVAVRYVHAFAATLPPGPVVIGRDGRQSGPMLAAAIADHLTALGRDVIDCGVAATRPLQRPQALLEGGPRPHGRRGPRGASWLRVARCGDACGAG